MEKVANYEPLEEDLAPKEDLGQSVFDEIVQKDSEVVQGKKITSNISENQHK